MRDTILRHSIVLTVLLALCAGCAAPPLATRQVQNESSWFVRLDSYQGEQHLSARPYEHPATWTVDDLSAILSRLLLEERVGLMDSPRPPQSVFSSEEIGLLAPVFQKAFGFARPVEWISFYLSQSAGQGIALTSGGLFTQGDRLHVVLANHRERLSPDSDEMEKVRINPLRSLRGPRGTLTFESSRFVMATRANWSGGHAAAASELVLDHQAFLAFLRLPGAGGTLSARPETTPSSGVTMERDDAGQKNVIQKLQEEVDRLRRKVEEQEAEIATLRQSALPPLPPKSTQIRPGSIP